MKNKNFSFAFFVLLMFLLFACTNKKNKEKLIVLKDVKVTDNNGNPLAVNYIYDDSLRTAQNGRFPFPPYNTTISISVQNNINNKFDDISIILEPRNLFPENLEIVLDDNNSGGLGCANNYVSVRGYAKNGARLSKWYSRFKDGNDQNSDYSYVSLFGSSYKECYLKDSAGFTNISLTDTDPSKVLVLKVKKSKPNSDTKINVVLTDTDPKENEGK